MKRALLAFVFLSACSVLTNPGSYEGGEAFDAGPPDVFDGGPDVSEPDAGSACGECMSPLLCDEDTATCVECVLNTDCPNGGVCRDGACPECELDADCMLPGAPLCSQNGDTQGQCVPCERNADCAGIRQGETFLSVCDSVGDQPGVCVECNGTGPMECGGNVCNVREKSCTELERNGTGICDTCVATAQCAGESVCVEESFMGAATDFYCLPPASPGCGGASVIRTPVSWPTVEGASAEVCRPSATTCAGFRHYSGDCMDDDDCGLSGVMDAFCVAATRCTHLCLADQDCEGAATCPIPPSGPRVCTLP